MKKRGNTNAKGIKKSLRGGGKRLESSPQRGEEAIVRVKRVTDTREGLKQNNNYSMPIFEVGTNVVAGGYVRSTPLTRISKFTDVH